MSSANVGQSASKWCLGAGARIGRGHEQASETRREDNENLDGRTPPVPGVREDVSGTIGIVATFT